jgi:hypothetical protein
MFVHWLVTIYFSGQDWLEILTIGIPMQMSWPRYVIYAFALCSIGSNDGYFLHNSNGIIHACWNCLLSFQMIGKVHWSFVSLSSPVHFTATVFYYLLIFFRFCLHKHIHYSFYWWRKKEIFILDCSTMDSFCLFQLLPFSFSFSDHSFFCNRKEKKNVNIALICICLEMETGKTNHFTVVWMCSRIWKLQGYVQIIHTSTSMFN